MVPDGVTRCKVEVIYVPIWILTENHKRTSKSIIYQEYSCTGRTGIGLLNELNNQILARSLMQKQIQTFFHEEKKNNKKTKKKTIKASHKTKVTPHKTKVELPKNAPLDGRNISTNTCTYCGECTTRNTCLERTRRNETLKRNHNSREGLGKCCPVSANNFYVKNALCGTLTEPKY